MVHFECVGETTVTAAVDDLALSGDGTRYALAYADRTLAVFDVGTNALVGRTTYPSERGYQITVALSPDGSHLAAGSDWYNSSGKTYVWRLSDMSRVAELSTGGHTIVVKYSPDGTLLATAGTWGGSLEANQVIMWRTDTWTVAGYLRGHTWRTHALIFSASGSKIATAGEDRQARIWDAGSFAQMRAFNLGPGGLKYGGRLMDFSNDEDLLTAREGGGKLQTWRVSTGVKESEFSDGSYMHFCGLTLADANYLVATSEGNATFRVFDRRTGNRVQTVVPGEWLVLATGRQHCAVRSGTNWRFYRILGLDAQDRVSTLTATPTTVVADNTAMSTLTLTYKNADGSPIVGHSIRFFTDRMDDDTLSSESAVTDAEGKASITVKSEKPGVSTYTCRDDSDQERTLACKAQVTFTSPGGGPKFTCSASVGEGASFIKGIKFPNKITVRVQDWGGSPGVVRFDLNGQVKDMAAPSGEASIVYDMGVDLLYPPGPSSRAWSTLKITVINGEDQESAPQELHWMGLDLPPLLTCWMPGTVPFGLALGRETVYSLALTWPPKGVNLSKTQTGDDRCMAGGIWGAVLGQFEAAVEVTIKPAHYPSTDVEGEVKVSFGADFERTWNKGGRKPKNKLTVAGIEAEADVLPYLSVHFLPDWYTELGLESTIKTTLETPDILSYFAPTNPAAATAALLLDIFGRLVLPSVSGRLAFSDETGEWQFSQGSLTMGAVGSLVVSIDRSVKEWLQVEAEAGLKAGFGLQFPGSDENTSKYGNRNFAAYGASFFVRGKLVSKIPFLEQSHEWPAVNFAWTEPANWDGLEALSKQPRRPAPRTDKEYGPPSREYLSSQEPYHRLVPGPVRHPFQPWLDHYPGHAGKLDSGTWDVAELKLVENVNNVASPSLAYLDGKAVIVYVYDRPSLPAHQATEIRMLRQTATGWVDVDVTNDTALDSQPSVAVSPDGKLVAVWTRMANVLETDDPAARYSKAEIAWSVWDPVSETWSPAAAITSDALLDLNPRLAVGRDGLMYLTWLKSPDNVFPTDFSTRQLPHTDLWVARWNGSSFVDAERAIARIDTGEHVAYAASSTGECIAVWSQDRDGDAASNDPALFFSRYAGGAWTAPERVDGADAQPQSTPAITFTTSDVATLFYVRSGLPNVVHADHMEEHLVVSTLAGGVWSAPLFVARSGNMAHLDIVATPDGKASAIWTASSAETADLWSTVFDPTTGTFNVPVPLTKDQADERQLWSTWDPAGNPSVAYLKRRLEEQERQVEDDQGNPHTVTVLAGVANDLYLLTHAPKPDVAVTDAGLTVDPPAAGPGDTATLSVTVRNLRALAASDVQVRFVDRTPDGDAIIATVTTDPAIIVGGGSAVASTTWTVPSDSKAHTIVAVVDPEGAIVETDETNNEVSYALLRPDLAAGEPYAKEYLPDGSLKIGLPIRNPSPVSFGAPVEWKLWLGDAGTGTLLRLGTTSAPEPGQTQEVEVVWTPGGLTPSDPALTLVLDPDDKLADDDRSNNSASGVIALRPDLILNPYNGRFAWNADGTGTVEVTLQNNGWCAAQNIVVTVLSGPPDAPGTVSLGSTTVANLDRYASTRLSVSIGSNGGLTEVYVIANPDGAIGEVRRDNNTIILTVPSRAATSLWTVDRVGTITELAILRQYDLKRLSDNALLEGKTISFRIDGTEVGTAVTNAGGDSTLNWIITDGPATRTITAAFAGDAAYEGCSDDASLTAQSWTTKMATFDRTARITDRTELKCRFLRSDNTPLYNKTINFYVDGTFVIARPTNVQGYASYPFYDVPDGAGAGVRTILSEWPGNGGYAAISRTANLTVLKAIPYIWVMPRSVMQGQAARLYAYFRRLYDYAKQEGKTVTWRIDGTWIGESVTGTTESGEPGVARFNYDTSGLSLGTHTVRCEWAGDAWVDAGYGQGNLTIY